jgi:hypothetical protein
MVKFNKTICVLLPLLFTSIFGADLPVVEIDEEKLPYELSPSNYENSSGNYGNSIGNYENSEGNYNNSPGNYNNSPSNFDNGKLGKRRLIIKDGITESFAGYYVVEKNGPTNFYSPGGTRIFYNPKKGQAVFSSENGEFCGVLAKVDGVYSLALTNKGMKLLFLSD